MNWKCPPSLLVGAVGLVVGVAYVLRIMIPHDLDPTIMIAFGENSPAHSAYARGLVGDVVLRPAFGHDGQDFFIQANDPWLLNPESHAILLDNAIYRSQRMAYPMIASGFGLFPPRAVVWTLPLVNVLALGAGTVITSRLSSFLGGSPWLGLAFCLNLGLLSEVDISGSGAVALAFAVAGVLAAEKGRPWAAALLLAGAALSRETMLAWAVVVGWFLWRKGIDKWWASAALPMAAVGLWGFFIRYRLSGLPSLDIPFLAPFPFAGPVDAYEFWRSEPSNLLIIFALVMVAVAFAVRVVRSRQLLGWAAAPSLLIAATASVSVWRYPYDIARVLAPILLAYPLLAFIANPKPKNELDVETGLS